ncbi:MAG: UDP-3-O-(3-hydroxymyristoyl)glucosamine N-acyltransferase [Deltaproteobacteria bacterium]|jgi:UDP-3-O-[3-hydroxymyristoyl] glucosamine N-acyltransferase|nr:UDP-3-O-(3-hydroxymyristoyl)glucosamine N-acyltransferase [Deltaproteobacteria bacterium]
MLRITPRPLDALLAEAVGAMDRVLAAAGGGSPPAYEIRGDRKTAVEWLCAFKEKAPPAAMTFAVKAKFLAEAVAMGAAVIVTSPGLEPPSPAPVLVVTPDPRLLFVSVLETAERELRPDWPESRPYMKDGATVELGRDVVFGPGCCVGADVSLGDRVRLGPGVVVGDGAKVGPDTVIHPRAVLCWQVRIGARCVIGPGAVIGWDGFGYTQVPDPAAGRVIHYRNPHLGGVVIEDDVEIGANTCVDRGLVEDTVIRRGTKLDNLVQVGHNCEIGRDCLIASQAGTAGHSFVGDRAIVLGQAGLSHGTRVGADAIITGQTGVTGEIPPGREAWSGTPSIKLDESLRVQALARRFLPRLRVFFNHFHKSSSFDDLKERYADHGEGRK